ncbi:MAG: ATP-binding cassette domain-containing protein [Gammaproteobacteria bacterium]
MADNNNVVAALEIRAVTKAFGSLRAVNGLNLSVKAGEFCALLGPNGAGKTTTLRMIAGLLRPESGYVRIFDVDVVDEPARAGAGPA